MLTKGFYLHRFAGIGYTWNTAANSIAAEVKAYIFKLVNMLFLPFGELC